MGVWVGGVGVCGEKRGQVCGCGWCKGVWGEERTDCVGVGVGGVGVSACGQGRVGVCKEGGSKVQG